MAASGTRKAAMLLMSLDGPTATELLKSASQEAVTQIAAELAYLKTAGQTDAMELNKAVRDFVNLLAGGGQGPGAALVRHLIEGAVGRQKSDQVLHEVEQIVRSRDPFLTIRSAEVYDLAKALQGESAPVAAMVLAELPARKSIELLPLLDEEIRGEVIRGMASGEDVAPATRYRVATVVRQRLDALSRQEKSPDGVDRRTAQLRKVAILLRGLSLDSRTKMLQAITEKNPEAGDAVVKLMVIWEDVPTVADRPIQEVLRGIDSRKLAVALFGATEALTTKIRKNMSERASTMLDEELSLLGSPKQVDIDAAREEILVSLRELNAAGMLEFVEA